MTSNKLYLAAGHLLEWCAGLCAEMDKKKDYGSWFAGLSVYCIYVCFLFLFLLFFFAFYLKCNLSDLPLRHIHTHTVHSVMFPGSLEKHDWSHEVWLLSCKSESVTSDRPRLLNVGFADGRSCIFICLFFAHLESATSFYVIQHQCCYS